MEGKSQGDRKGRGSQNRSHHSGGGGGNRSRSNRGGQNRNRSRNRSGGGRKPQRQPKKKTFLEKILGFFGIGKSNKGGKGKGKGRSNKDRKGPKRAEVTSGRLYVGNLDYDLSGGELEQFFSKVGKVVSAEIVTHGNSDRSKGFAFVEMSSTDEAKRAVAELDGKQVGSRPILVSGAKADKRSKPDSGEKRRDRDRDRDRDSERPRGRDRNRGDRKGNQREGRDSKRQKREKPDIEVSPKRTVTVSSTSLAISSLDTEATQEDLQDIFRGISEPISVEISTGAGGQTGSVEFDTVESAQNAVNVLDGKKFMGRRLKFSDQSEADSAKPESAAVQSEPAATEPESGEGETWSPSE